MTRFELLYHCIRALDHPLYQRVYQILSGLGPSKLLDVGGRRSNYTIGLTSRVTVSDIIRESDVQHSLDLGTTDTIKRQVLSRRSNVCAYVVDDMARTALPPKRYDAVVAVEVLEHVEEDAAFVQNVAKVLKPGGSFVMTTPNGDFIPRPYLDHKRHYTKDGLTKLLSQSFDQVHVEYAVNEGRLIQLGVYRPTLRHPVRSLVAVLCLGLGAMLERCGVGGTGPYGKRHLIAVAKAIA